MKKAFLFPGQGAQVLGMAKEFYDNIPASRRMFDIASEALRRDIAAITFGEDAIELGITHNTQPCLLAAELACLAALENEGQSPDVVAGFSLGEWSALVAAGVLEPAEAFVLVQKRADAMQNAVAIGEGGMLAILGIEANAVNLLCDEVGGDVWPSNHSCPGQVTVAGKKRAIDRMQTLCENRGICCIPVAISVPSHCPLMRPAVDELRVSIENVVFNDARIPIVMNATGLQHTNANEIRHNMLSQLISPVLFFQSLLTMEHIGTELFVEVGPGRVLSGFAKKTIPGVSVIRVSDMQTIQKALERFNL